MAAASRNRRGLYGNRTPLRASEIRLCGLHGRYAQLEDRLDSIRDRMVVVGSGHAADWVARTTFPDLYRPIVVGRSSHSGRRCRRDPARCRNRGDNPTVLLPSGVRANSRHVSRADIERPRVRHARLLADSYRDISHRLRA